MTTDPTVELLLQPPREVSARRDAPDAAFVELMSAAYPVETEVDAVLRRKLEHRSQPAHAVLALPDLVKRLEAFLAEHVDGPFRVEDARPLSGGGAKIQVGFTLHRTSGPDRTDPLRLVLRIDPPESLNATSRAREFEVLGALIDQPDPVPVPRPYWLDARARWFPEPGLIYSFATGVTKPPGGRVSGVASDFGPDLRAKLAPQFVAHLARVHTADLDPAAIPSCDEPRIGTSDAALWQLNRARRIWDEDRCEDLPVIEVAASWLARNAPALDVVSLVHGDYRSGNFLYDPADGRITAILDWERTHLGDRHRDLAWTALNVFGHHDEQGRFLASGILEREQFFRDYTAATGLSVDPARLRYYEMLNLYQLVASTLGTAYRLVRLGKTHQDVLLTWLEGFTRHCVSELRRLLAEEI